MLFESLCWCLFYDSLSALFPKFSEYSHNSDMLFNNNWDIVGHVCDIQVVVYLKLLLKSALRRMLILNIKMFKDGAYSCRCGGTMS